MGEDGNVFVDVEVLDDAGGGLPAAEKLGTELTADFLAMGPDGKTTFEFEPRPEGGKGKGRFGKKPAATDSSEAEGGAEKAEKIDPKKAAITRADGKAVTVEVLAKLLEKPGMVMIAANFEKVDPFYLQFLKAETLIVVPERPVVAIPIGPKP